MADTQDTDIDNYFKTVLYGTGPPIVPAYVADRLFRVSFVAQPFTSRTHYF